MAKRVEAVWHKIVTITEFGVGLPKSKQLGLGQCGKNSSYDHLRNCYKDPLVPVKPQFLEEIAKSLNKFLLVFQTDKPMAAFLAETLEQLLCYFCSKFVKKDDRKHQQSQNQSRQTLMMRMMLPQSQI